MSFICTECTLDSLGTVVAAELACHIHWLVRKHLEYLRIIRAEETRPACKASRVRKLCNNRIESSRYRSTEIETKPLNQT